MTYQFLRHFADSWGLLIMVMVFVGLCAWAFRPGARGHHQQAATLIFKDDDNE